MRLRRAESLSTIGWGKPAIQTPQRLCVGGAISEQVGLVGDPPFDPGSASVGSNDETVTDRQSGSFQEIGDRPKGEAFVRDVAEHLESVIGHAHHREAP